MSNDEGNKPRSLREIAARAKEARSAAPAASASDLLEALQARPSVPPPDSVPPGTLPSGSLRTLSSPPSAPPVSSPPPASLPPPSQPKRVSSPPQSQASPTSISVPPTTLRNPGVAGEAGGAVDSEVNKDSSLPLATPPAHEQRSVTPILLGVGLIAALGLGVVLTRKKEPSSEVLSAPAISAEVKANSASEPKVSASGAPAESVVPSVSAEPGIIDINSLGAEPSAKAAPRGSGPLHKAGDAPEIAAASAVPPPAEPVATASAAPRPMGSVGELIDEMRKRVGATDSLEESTDKGPAKNLDAKQEKPSNAAVSGALGAVRGAVKNCIADLEKSVRINVTFQSDGSVRSVSVSGAGGAESCVQAAVRKAKVAPFMKESFSTSFSVSP